MKRILLCLSLCALLTPPANAGTLRKVVTFPLYIMAGTFFGPVLGFIDWYDRELKREDDKEKK